jgi:hypothetical protein
MLLIISIILFVSLLYLNIDYILEYFKILKKNTFSYYIYNIIINNVSTKFIDYTKYLDYYKIYKNNKYIMQRVNYYNKINEKMKLYKFKKKLPFRDLEICDKIRIVIKNIKRSTYKYDLLNISKYFNDDYIISIKTGDVRNISLLPTFVKTRNLNCYNSNNILCKWNKKRHFHFINDKIDFENKINMLIWRGSIHKIQDHTGIRNKLITKFKSNDLMNINYKDYITIEKQMKYKFILSLEGYDVATNLKWIMNSNSLCFMPKPTCESWFMEGTLIPNFHYVEIKDDFSDLEDKIKYYIDNVKECKKIIKNANKYTNQFKNLKREHIIEILTFNKYIENLQI